MRRRCWGQKNISIKGSQIECEFAESTSINPKNPNTVKGLIDLQILDWVTGQVDRHPENYYIKGDGSIVAIDNDCAFGKDAIKPGQDVRQRKGGLVPNDGNLMLRLPPVITQEQRMNILNMKAEELKDSLGSLLDSVEVDKTIERLKLLQQHVNSSDCKVVGTPGELVKAENLMKMDSNNSYLMREMRVYDEDASNWNHLRKFRVD